MRARAQHPVNSRAPAQRSVLEGERRGVHRPPAVGGWRPAAAAACARGVPARVLGVATTAVALTTGMAEQAGCCEGCRRLLRPPRSSSSRSSSSWPTSRDGRGDSRPAAAAASCRLRRRRTLGLLVATSVFACRCCREGGFPQRRLLAPSLAAYVVLHLAVCASPSAPPRTPSISACAVLVAVRRASLFSCPKENQDFYQCVAAAVEQVAAETPAAANAREVAQLGLRPRRRARTAAIAAPRASGPSCIPAERRREDRACTAAKSIAFEWSESFLIRKAARRSSSSGVPPPPPPPPPPKPPPPPPSIAHRRRRCRRIVAAVPLRRRACLQYRNRSRELAAADGAAEGVGVVVGAAAQGRRPPASRRCCATPPRCFPNADRVF